MINKDYGFDNPQKRKETLEHIKQVVNDHKNNLRLELTVKALSMIGTLVDTQEQIIEDQAERIAIMSEGGWHDAEKDPPKETDCYIVRIDYGVGQMTTMREYVSSEGKWLKSIEEKITHWMQLPEPPEEGDGK